MKFSMPKVVFNDEMEGKLIELWAHYQRVKSGTMKKRSQKEKEIAEDLNLYGLDMAFDGKSQIHVEVIAFYQHSTNISADQARREKFKFSKFPALSPCSTGEAAVAIENCMSILLKRKCLFKCAMELIGTCLKVTHTLKSNFLLVRSVQGALRGDKNVINAINRVSCALSTNTISKTCFHVNN